MSSGDAVCVSEPSEPKHWLSVTGLLNAYRHGDTDPVAVTSALIKRIQRLNPELAAFEQVFEAPALAAAQASKERWARTGQCHEATVRPLEGVPVAVKDLLTTVEGPTAVGTGFLGGYLPWRDADVVRKLREAGAIVLGKTSMTEGAFALHHPACKTPINPWAPDRSPGVSSSGSAVAVASGMCPLALGTDTGGSIRFPCSNNRLVGLKSTRGTVGTSGCFPLSTWLDHIGPIVRTVHDLEPVMQAMGWQPRPEQMSTGRIAVDREQLAQRCSSKIRYAFEGILQTLKQLGYELVNCDLEDVQWPLAKGWLDWVSVSALSAYQEFRIRHTQDFGLAFGWLLQRGFCVPTDRLHEVEHLATVWSSRLTGVLSDVDALICPVSPQPNVRLGPLNASPSPEAMAESVYYTAPFNFSGHPALTLPMAFIDGAPAGFQLIGRCHDEAGLLTLGRRFEAAKPWPERPTDFD